MLLKIPEIFESRKKTSFKPIKQTKTAYKIGVEGEVHFPRVAKAAQNPNGDDLGLWVYIFLFA